MELGRAFFVALIALAGFPKGALAEPYPAMSEGEAQMEVATFLEQAAASYATSKDNGDVTIIDRRFGAQIEGDSGVWIYSQLNTGDEQKLYRQRLHHMIVSEDQREIIQRSYIFKKPERFVDPWSDPTALFALTKDDIEPALPDGCDQVWRKGDDGFWRGKVDPETCMVFSERRQAHIRIGADGYYHDGVYATSERGFDEQMNPIWGSKPGEYILHHRCVLDDCAQEAKVLRERTK